MITANLIPASPFGIVVNLTAFNPTFPVGAVFVNSIHPLYPVTSHGFPYTVPASIAASIAASLAKIAES